MVTPSVTLDLITVRPSRGGGKYCAETVAVAARPAAARKERIISILKTLQVYERSCKGAILKECC